MAQSAARQQQSGVQNAQVTRAANQNRQPKPALRPVGNTTSSGRKTNDNASGQTIDARVREQRGQYSSVRNTRDLRKANSNKNNIEQLYQRPQSPTPQQRAGRAVTRRVKTAVKPKALKIGHVIKMRILIWISIPIYGLMAFMVFIQIAGLGLAAGLAQTFDWIPLFGDDIAAGAYALGFLVFAMAWGITSATLFILNTIICVVKKLPTSKRVLFLTLSVIPLVQLFSFIVLFSRK